MGWTKYGLLALILVVLTVVSAFGGAAGYTVKGEVKGVPADENPVLSTFAFGWDLVTFQIDNMPPVINAVFIVLNILAFVVIVAIIKGE